MRLPASTVTLQNGVMLAYASHGDPSGPSLVLLPGPADSWRSYEPVLAQLPPSVRAIAVSQRGHGDSDKPAVGYGVEDFAADVVPLLDELGIERAVVAGHSGSCLVARRVAIDHPDRVAGLVLEASPTTLRGHPGLESFVESVVSSLTDPIDPTFARSFVTDTSAEGLTPDVLDLLAGEIVKVPARAWKEMFARLLDLRRPGGARQDQRSDAAGLGRRRRPRRAGMQDMLTARIRGANLVVYPGVGHTPRWEDPSRFANDVGAFVERMGYA
ncbi:MAG: alpha/beta fold hydrolase [Acidimicrobiia bacterium]